MGTVSLNQARNPSMSGSPQSGVIQPTTSGLDSGSRGRASRGDSPAPGRSPSCYRGSPVPSKSWGTGAPGKPQAGALALALQGLSQWQPDPEESWLAGALWAETPALAYVVGLPILIATVNIFFFFLIKH